MVKTCGELRPARSGARRTISIPATMADRKGCTNGS